MSGTERDNGWLEAAIAWEVCASLHRQYCKGKDALFTTRQSDFVKHAEDARARASHGQASSQPEVSADQDDSILLCVSGLQHSAIYDNHVEMQACIQAVVDRIRGLVSSSQHNAKRWSQTAHAL